eukprot:1300083-Rhodomonas_salina.1
MKRKKAGQKRERESARCRPGAGGAASARCQTRTPTRAAPGPAGTCPRACEQRAPRVSTGHRMAAGRSIEDVGGRHCVAGV